MATSRYPNTFWALVERSAGERPGHVILADEHGRQLTAAAYRDGAERVAAGLLARGVQPGDRLSWQIPSSLEAVVLLGACVRLGVVQNPIIPILRQAEVGFITGQVGTQWLVVPRLAHGFDFVAMAEELAVARGFAVVELDLRGTPGPGELRLPTGDPATLPPPAQLDHSGDEPVRWVYYSSGTTSRPKGARHTDASVMAGATGLLEHQAFSAADIYPIAWPITHIGGAVLLTCSLVCGLRQVLYAAFDPATSPARMAADSPTILGSAVPFFNAYVEAQAAEPERVLFPAARICIGGGSSIPQEVNDAVRRWLGVAGIVGSWGLTEFPIATAAFHDDDPAVLALSVGHAVSGVDIRTVTADGRVGSPGDQGELQVRGPQCCQGYIDPDLDRDGFTADGWFRTGDLGVIHPDGNVQITGRLKDIIIRNAENISALEVEEVLHRHPAVFEASAIGLADPRTGERVCAVVVLRTDASLTLESLRDHCRALGLAMQKCPEKLVIVDELPRNSMGKVVKATLVAQVMS